MKSQISYNQIVNLQSCYNELMIFRYVFFRYYLSRSCHFNSFCSLLKIFSSLKVYCLHSQLSTHFLFKNILEYIVPGKWWFFFVWFFFSPQEMNSLPCFVMHAWIPQFKFWNEGLETFFSVNKIHEPLRDMNTSMYGLWKG